MSEEEKKAYDNLIMLKYFTMEKEDKQSIDIILNLVDKLQKENAELKEELFVERKTHISKYAIRNKIKELESKKEQYNEQPLIYHILKNQLEELLGE